MNDQAQLHEILDRLRNRFFGKYRGTVSDVDASTMSVKAYVPAVLGDQASGWCQPCVPYAGPNVGFCMLPEVGSGVWIEFEAGDVSRPIWVGCFWYSTEVPSTADLRQSPICRDAQMTLALRRGSFYLGEGRFHTLRFSVTDVEILRGGGLLRGARP